MSSTSKNQRKTKILFIDIETSPNIVYSFHVGRNVFLSYENIKEERQIICICYKWHGDRKVRSIDWGGGHNDKQLLKKISKEILSADIIVAQNGDKYDIRFINGRLAYHHLPPLGELTTRDTLKQTRKVFFLNSHALGYAANYFGLGKKIQTSFNDWRDVVENVPGALDKMIRYCKRDVILLEKYYNHVSKYAPQRINIGKIEGKDEGCPNCGSSDTIFYGNRYFGGAQYKRKLCRACAHTWRTKLKYVKFDA